MIRIKEQIRWSQIVVIPDAFAFYALPQIMILDILSFFRLAEEVLFLWHHF